MTAYNLLRNYKPAPDTECTLTRADLEATFAAESWSSMRIAEFLHQHGAPRRLIEMVCAASQRVYWRMLQPSQVFDDHDFIEFTRNLRLSLLQAAMVLTLRQLAAEFDAHIHAQHSSTAAAGRAAKKANQILDYVQCLFSCTEDLGLDWPFLIRNAADHYHFNSRFQARCDELLRHLPAAA